jgi:type IV pilus assembly protein PilE
MDCVVAMQAGIGQRCQPARSIAAGSPGELSLPRAPIGRTARHAPVTRHDGFTALELMVTVAIVAILAGIALPNYVDHVRRSRLTDAFQTMTQFRMRMEQGFQDNGNYGVAGGACAVATPAASPYFSFACALGANGGSFTMTAAGQNLMTGYAFTVDDAGNQRTTAFPRATVPVACWLNRPGDC